MEKKRGFGGGPALIPMVLLGAIALAGCGGGVTTAGGGTGGTGISTGTVTGFGSVKMYEAEYRTDNAVKVVNGVDNSAGRDQDVFRIGMVVTVKFNVDDNNATEIDYEDNLKGPIGGRNGADRTIVVLGRPVVVDNAALFGSLADNNVVEVSGFADNTGRIRATFVEVKSATPQPDEEFEIKGFVSGLSSTDNTFFLGPLPGGTGMSMEVGYTTSAIRDLPGGPSDGMYVEVKTVDTRPTAGRIEASKVERAAARTDFPEGAKVTLEGLVTRVNARQGKEVFLEVEGKVVQTSGATAFSGGDATNIQPNARLQAEGTISGGILSASRIIFR